MVARAAEVIRRVKILCGVDLSREAWWTDAHKKLVCVSAVLVMIECKVSYQVIAVTLQATLQAVMSMAVAGQELCRKDIFFKVRVSVLGEG